MPSQAIEGFRLSPQQVRLWALQRATNGAFYYTQCLVGIEGPLDRRALEQAFNALVNRHEILRTDFAFLDGTPLPVQSVRESGRVIFNDYDFRALAREEHRRRVERLYDDGLRREFDYTASSVPEVSLIALRDSSHAMIVRLPALHGDGASLISLIGELSLAYGSRSGVRAAAAEPIQYADVAEVFSILSESEEGRTGREYWRTRAGGLTPAFTLGFESEGGQASGFWPALLRREIALPQARRLAELGRRTGTSAQAVLLACWAVLIWRLCQKPQIVIGTLYDGRTFEDLQAAVGPFARYLPLAFHFDKAPCFADLLGQVEHAMRDSYDWQNYFNWAAFAQPSAGPEPELYYSACFDFRQAKAACSAGALKLSVQRLFSCIDRFKIRLSCMQTEDALSAEFYYDAALFEEDDIRRLAGQYLAVLEGVLADARANVSNLEVVGEEERALILDGFCQRRDPGGGFIHQPVEEQARCQPEATALVYESLHVSYAELNARANQLAHHLSRLGVRPESLVGIFMERSPEMAIALLAVLKAGAAYLPLDPEYPQERLIFLLEDTGTELLLIQERLMDRLPHYGGSMLAVDRHWQVIDGESRENPPGRLAVENLAYVIYTSGSTGRPKGAMLTHAGVHNCIAAKQEIYRLDRSDKSLFKTSLNFDPSVYEYFWPLWEGACVVIARPGGHYDASYLVDVMANEQVTMAYFVPSMLRGLLAERRVTGCAALRKVMCGGESLPSATMASFFSKLSADLHHSYGPTETSIGTTDWACARDWQGARIPIGKPLANIQVLIMRPECGLVPIKITGELAIAGSGVGRGYLGRPELTAERFVPHPYSPQPGARLYRSGDLARFTPHGEIEFLGRVDYQIKLRGQRIELGEIEALLREGGAREAAVVLSDGAAAESVLTAYVVTGQETPGLAADLMTYLKKELPDYMVPAQVVVLDEMPLTPNGKIDRIALAATVRSIEEGSDARTPVEELLAGIWAEVLRRKHVGVEANFFALGGHSLLATQVVSRVREVLQVELGLRELFERPTVAGLAATVERERRAGRRVEAPAMVRVSRAGELPLSFAQQRLWFIHQLEPESAAYNIPAAVRLAGALNPALLRQSLGEIARRHEVLRTSLRMRESEPVQVIAEPCEMALPVWDLSDLGEDHRGRRAREIVTQEARRPFDLERGPVWRAALLRLGAEDHVLLISLHHVASDGWSTGLMVREFTALYESYGQGRRSALPELPVQYADFALWQREWLRGAVLQRQLDYWRNQLEGVPVLELPTDRPRPAVASHRGERVGFTLSAELTQKINHLSRREGVTLFMALLAAYQTLLARYSGQEEILIGTPISGRNRAETEALIGLFVNTLIVRADLSGRPTVAELLARVRETALGAYAHQDLPFEKLVEELQPERSLSHGPLFQVMFIFQNAPRAEGRVTGVKITRESVSARTAKFDLTLSLTEIGGHIQGELEYATDLYDESRAIRMLEHFRRVLEGMTQDASRRVKELRLLSEAERQQVIVEWNDTASPPSPWQPLHASFAQQAAQAGHRIAVISARQHLSYGCLNEQANRMAHYLIALGVGPEVCVALALARSPRLVIGLLGVLKAGAAYVPLEVSLPAERLEYMLEDSQAMVVVSEAAISVQLPRSGATLVEMETDSTAISGCAASDPQVEVVAANLAYVIYTSGTTGRPKGVMVTQGGLRNYVEWARRSYEVGQWRESVVSSSLSFDLTVTSLLVPLVSGAAVRLEGEEGGLGVLASLAASSDGERLLKVTPGQLHLLRQQRQGGRGFGGGEVTERLGRVVVIGGEALKWEELRGWEGAGGVRLINEYGPTETVVGCSVYEAAGADEQEGMVPIGRPITNTRLYVSQWGEEQGVGGSGELYIGGAGVSRGYMGRAAETAERFVPDGVSGERGGRLYGSGDEVRWRGDGELEYVGRRDEQVKVRGYRVELGEIEAVVMQEGRVRQCAVVVRGEGSGEKRLVAYVVKREGEEEIDGKQLREYVRSKLPEYMVPSVFVAIEEMPLTANGKLDRKRLPAPQFEQRENVVAPRESTELQLFQIWSDVLRREDFGVRDNFFDLGGHSFAAMTLMSRVSELYQRKIAIRTIFECPTIELLARYLQEEVACAPPSVIVPIQPRGTRRPFFAVHPLGGLVHYYIPLSRRLGKEQPFYGIQVYGIDVGQTPLSVMEEVAAIYVEDMRRIQPAGPYQLGGYSFGAVVAYEMAQQLYAAGEEVSLLVLIDTTAPTAADGTLSSAGEAIPEPELENLPEWLGMFGLRVDESEMEATSVQDFAERYMRRHGIKGDLSTYLQLYRATEANLIAKRHYRAKPYPGRIALFRGNAPGEPDSGWSRLAPDRVSVYHFDIAHDYFLFEINIDAVAARLSSCLAQSASPGPLGPETLPAVGGERPRPLSGGAGTTPS